ncbi:transcription factor Cys6 [Pochonia chlamydosporia 170]|uniref:Transcription factor Cys6 n=1 Tax=Pochonia chlamydosporia 170 TaxID=1380566 RepID=A0A179FIS0_METCM|nr:transcription factor Cys6 [Pochonia chlamydosporia 170]OAQ64929.1 transcription factor Cys6 [Pochonia chlamydosporia 170]
MPEPPYLGIHSSTAKLKPPTYEFRWLCLLPDLIRYPAENKCQIQLAYNYILHSITCINTVIETIIHTPEWTEEQAMVVNERSGLFISIGVVLNAIMRTFHPDDALLRDQRLLFVGSAVALGERGLRERPLGGHHIAEALLAAWCVADGSSKVSLRKLVEDYRETFSMAKLIHNVAFWPEAPVQLEGIPWITLHKGADCPASKTDGRDKGRAKGGQDLSEYCCIL